jgi:hypothetical protein
MTAQARRPLPTGTGMVLERDLLRLADLVRLCDTVELGERLPVLDADDVRVALRVTLEDLVAVRVCWETHEQQNKVPVGQGGDG